MIRVSIVCDKCRAVGFVGEGAERQPAHVMRADLRYVGWLTGSLSGHPLLSGKDYCPECKQWAINSAKGKRVKG